MRLNLRAFFRCAINWLQSLEPGKDEKEPQIEDYRLGYPRFSALVGSTNDFHITRRFRNLRARLLLVKQNDLAVLEGQLNDIDQEEPINLYLSSLQHDTNIKRNEVLLKIDQQLAEYDTLIERNSKILNFRSANTQNIIALQHWVDGNPCLARKETAYLRQRQDLLTIGSEYDDDIALRRVETWVEKLFIRFWGGFRELPYHNLSRDSHVFISSGTLTRRIARVIMAAFVITLLLAPVFICNSLLSSSKRIAVIVMAAILFITLLAVFTKVKSADVFLAGATYMTVLVVFVSNGSPQAI